MTDAINYARLAYEQQQHHRRYAAYVDAHGFTCQSCGGMGGERDVILDDGTGPWEECEWCEGTGRVTRWRRGAWLRWQRMLRVGRRRSQRG